MKKRYITPIFLAGVSLIPLVNNDVKASEVAYDAATTPAPPVEVVQAKEQTYASPMTPVQYAEPKNVVPQETVTVWEARPIEVVQKDILFETNNGEKLEYTVKWGDTLSTIASATTIPIDELIRLNEIADPNRIYVGQQLKFPSDWYNHLLDSPTQGKVEILPPELPSATFNDEMTDTTPASPDVSEDDTRTPEKETTETSNKANLPEAEYIGRIDD